MIRITYVVCTIAVLALGFPSYLTAAQRANDGHRPDVHVPVSKSIPEINGKLDDPCWKQAAAIGPLLTDAGKPLSETTALVFRDADRLYVGVANATNSRGPLPAESADISQQEHVALRIDSNRDRNSYYLVILTQRGVMQASYNEHRPPWHDPTWNRRKPRFQCATATNDNGWCAEFSIPFAIFDKNRELAAEIGFNISRYDASNGQTYCWCGDFSNPLDDGLLTNIPPRHGFPSPPLEYYAGCYQLDGGYRQGFNARETVATSNDPRLRLGPGSTHPCTTGEVRIELEKFLLGGNVHARSLIWDLAVDVEKGELYVLSAARRKSAIQLRVFDRAGKYLRTIMPFNPALRSDRVSDLCRRTVVEGEVELVVPKLFETCGTEPSIYGEYWHLPQSMVLAPHGDLLLSNLFKRTLWRIRRDGSLPAEGWTSIFNPRRNEPFESAGWLIGPWHANGLNPYLSYGKFCLPDMCFDKNGDLFVSGGAWSPLSQFYSTNWEVPGRGQGEAVWKYRPLKGTVLEPLEDFQFNGTSKTAARNHLGFEGKPGADDTHFHQPCGLAIDQHHLIVADSGNNRLQVFEKNGRLATSIHNFSRNGKEVPFHHPTALAMDDKRCLYVLATMESQRRLIKLKSWQKPVLLATSEPLHKDTIRIAVDSGVDPSLVWIANGAGRGSLVQLSGDRLSLTGRWAENQQSLSSPGQYGYVPILNIDPQNGDLYVEDDSYYHRGLYGEVYRADQHGKVLKKWPALLFNEIENWDGELLYSQAHATPVFRYPDEPRFLDSFFGKDGRIYRWKRDAKTVEILRFDRVGKPVPFQATGSHALVVDRLPKRSVQPRNHFVYRGLDVDAQGTVYYVNSRNSVDVYETDGNLRHQDLLQLIDTRGLLVDEPGNLYVISCPRGPSQTQDGQWSPRELRLSKYDPAGGAPIWSRRWEGILGCGAGRVAWMQTTCVCLTPRLHQALDHKGYLYVANKFSVQVLDSATGRLVGEFGSYGNMDCGGKGSAYPHPELPFGTISALAVWKEWLYVVDAMNARIAKCRIIWDTAGRAR